GEAARLKQDIASGAYDHVASRSTVHKSASIVIKNALRRSIADAYAAFVGQ
ncbi:hypothetical protein V8C86DRAFT_1766969, partial [Haematococcus lacustris]